MQPYTLPDGYTIEPGRKRKGIARQFLLVAESPAENGATVGEANRDIIGRYPDISLALKAWTQIRILGSSRALPEALRDVVFALQRVVQDLEIALSTPQRIIAEFGRRSGHPAASRKAA